MFQQGRKYEGEYATFIVEKHVLPWKVIIAFFIYILICAIITISAIVIENQNKENLRKLSDIEYKKEMNEKMKIASLTERYKLNDIDAITYTENIGKNRENRTINDENPTKLTIKYLAIKGLKNKDVENKVNVKISDEMTKWYSNDDLKNEDIDYINISATLTGNYANTISLYINKTTKYISSADERTYTKLLNLDLNTAEELEFEDIFLPGVSIKNIISQVVYDNLVNKYAMIDLDGNGSVDAYEENMNKVNMKDIEEKVYTAVRVYNENGVKYFYFNGSMVRFELDKAWYTMNIWEYYDKIAIYKRFTLEKDIFDGTHKKNAENFVCQNINENDEGETIIDNLICIRIQKEDLKNKSQYYIDKYNEYASNTDRIIEILKKQANDNKGQVIVFLSNININELNDYWSYKNGDEENAEIKKTDFLNDYEICEINRNECAVVIEEKFFKEEFLKNLYEKNYTVKDLVDFSKEKLFSVAGNKAKLENNSDKNLVIDLVTNLSPEDVIDKQFSIKAKEIEDYISKKDWINDEKDLDNMVQLFNANLDILDGKFKDSNDEKINQTKEKYRKIAKDIEIEMYDTKLIAEIKQTYEEFVSGTKITRESENANRILAQAERLSKSLEKEYDKNIYNNREVTRLLSEYNSKLLELQIWANLIINQEQHNNRENNQTGRENNTTTTNVIINNSTTNDITNNTTSNQTTNTPVNNTASNTTTNQIVNNTSSNKITNSTTNRITTNNITTKENTINKTKENSTDNQSTNESGNSI